MFRGMLFAEPLEQSCTYSPPLQPIRDRSARHVAPQSGGYTPSDNPRQQRALSHPDGAWRHTHSGAAPAAPPTREVRLGEPRPGGWQPPTCGALSAVGAETTSPPKPTAPAAPAARLRGLPGRQPLRRGVVLLEDVGLCAGAALPGAWGRKGCKPRRERQTVPMSGTEQGAAAPPARHMVALQPALYPGRWAFLHRRSR